MYNKKIINDKNITNFVEIIKDFCDIIENNNYKKIGNFSSEILMIFTNLIHYGLLLPDLEPIVKQPLKSAINQNNLTKIQSEIANIFGKYDYYWFIYDSVVKDEPVGSKLSLDITETYKELKNGLIEFMKDNDSNKINAIWYWRFGAYNTNWGIPVVNAIKALYNYIITY